MIQPQYSPQEALERIKLMMKYDTSKTLNENKEVISEQIDPTMAGTSATVAVAGGLAGAGLAAGAGVGTAVFPVVGTAVGALVGLGLGALASWADNKDKGRDAFAQLMAACKSAGASKLVPKMSKGEIRTLAYSIEDAKGDWNDDEDAIAATLQKIETIADLCALDKKVTGGLLEFLDGVTDSPSEWKMFTRPIEGMIEDSDIQLTPEEQKKSGEGVKNPDGGGVKKRGSSSYTVCTGTYKRGCKTTPDGAIGKVQGCLGLVQDGKFGPKTDAALKAKGLSSFTDADVDKICSKPEPVKPQTPGETNVEDVFNF